MPASLSAQNAQHGCWLVLMDYIGKKAVYPADLPVKYRHLVLHEQAGWCRLQKVAANELKPSGTLKWDAEAVIEPPGPIIIVPEPASVDAQNKLEQAVKALEKAVTEEIVRHCQTHGIDDAVVANCILAEGIIAEVGR